MTSVMASDLICSNAPVNWSGNLDGKIRNRILISVVVPETHTTSQEGLTAWLGKLTDIEGVIMASANGTAKGATALGVTSSAVTWSTTTLTYGNAETAGNVELLIVGGV